MPYFYMDTWYWILVLPALLISLWAQYRVSSTFRKYNEVRSVRGFRAEEVVRSILDENGLYQVQIERTSGELSDHYDPSSKVIRLSDSTYQNSSVAAIGVAAHETGHALQYAAGYFPIRIRQAIIPITQLGSTLAVPLALLGIVLSFDFLVTAGILLFCVVVFFQLVTLPVEFNASRRAIKTLRERNILEGEELEGAEKVLRAAALTYVAALLVALGNLFRLILLSRRRR